MNTPPILPPPQSARTPPRLPKAKSSLFSPILVSALVYPGAGQLMQRRWLAGGIWLAAFTAAGGWFFVRTVRVLIAYYSLAFDFSGAPEVHVRPSEIAVPFVAALLVYLACLVDAVVAESRSRRRANGAE